MKIIIDSTDVKTKSGQAKATGNPYTIREQEGYLDRGKRYPEPIRLNLEKDQAPWPPGEYAVDLDKSVYPGRFGSLEISSSPHLTKLQAPK